MQTPHRRYARFLVRAGLAAALAVCTIGAGRPYAVWLVGAGERNGHEVAIRFRDIVPNAKLRAQYPWRVVIAWPLHRDASGGHVKDEIERTLDFDVTLEQRIESPDLALGVASVTDDDVRDWTYYATDRAKVIEALQAIKRDDPTLPIRWEVDPDREWTALQNVMDTLKE